LDLLWARERSTVANNVRLMRRGNEYNVATGQEGMFPLMGPMPLEDVMVHAVAVQVLLALREADGKYHLDHSQYETSISQLSRIVGLHRRRGQWLTFLLAGISEVSQFCYPIAPRTRSGTNVLIKD
jgi:hypothetical protein